MLSEGNESTASGFEREETPIASAIMNGATMKSLKGFTSAQLESLYSLAYHDYQSGQYERAEKFFQLLTILDHLNLKYVLGYGAALKKTGKLTQAIVVYSCAYFLDSNDVRIPFYCGLCHIELNNLKEAESAFYLASSMNASTPEQKGYVQRAGSCLVLVRKKQKEAKSTQ